MHIFTHAEQWLYIKCGVRLIRIKQSKDTFGFQPIPLPVLLYLILTKFSIPNHPC